MISKFKIHGLIALLMMFALVSCSKKEDSNEKVLNILTKSKVKGFDPIYGNDLYSSREIARVYEGLLQYHHLKRPYVLEPDLADGMPKVSSDGSTYTFKIKKGVYFHDSPSFPEGKGRELTAHDFVYVFKRNADPKLNSLGWWLIDGKIKGLNEWREKYKKLDRVNYDEEVAGVKALDKYTVQFKLSRPFPQFLNVFAMSFFYVVPKEAVEHYGKEFLNFPVGTGAFTLGEFKQSNKIVYTKNPKFRDKFYPSEGMPGDKEKGLLDYAGKKLPFVDKVVLHIYPEDQPRWLNFMKGKVDYLLLPKDNNETALSPDQGLQDEMKKKGISLQVRPTLDVTYTAFNHNHELFSKNVYLKRAMSLAYDAARSVDLFYGGNALVAQSPIPPGLAGYRENYKNPYVGQNIEKAKELLAKAGYPDGKGLPVITYDTLATANYRQIAEFFVNAMSKIGVKIKVLTNTWPELVNKVRKAQTMTFYMSWIGDYPDAENFLQLMYGPNASPGSNGSNYNNPNFNKLFKKASMMQDSPERTRLYEKLATMAAEEVPWIYGVHRMDFFLKHEWLKNYKVTMFEDHMEQYLDVDMDQKNTLKEKL